MREAVIKRTLDSKLIAIVRGVGAEKIISLAEALLNGGISMIEVTFDQSRPETWGGTAKAISVLRSGFGGELFAGAGTVVSVEQVKIAAEAGAMYVISPNMDTRVINETRERGLVSMPGCLTSSECMEAHGAGADFIKLFPAGVLGAAYIKAIRAPLSHINFLAVGGINEKNMGEYLKAGVKGFGVGGNLVNKEWLNAGRFEDITALAKAYVSGLKENA